MPVDFANHFLDLVVRIYKGRNRMFHISGQLILLSVGHVVHDGILCSNDRSMTLVLMRIVEVSSEVEQRTDINGLAQVASTLLGVIPLQKVSFPQASKA